MTDLIGIGGKLASGKDAVADHLVEKHGWVKLGMSDALLEIALVLDPIIYARDTGYHGVKETRLSKVVDQQGYVKAKEHPEVRRFLQCLGTDVGRNMIDKNLWINKAQEAIQQHRSQGEKVVITGIRFDNEFDMIKNNGGTLLWLDRPDQTTGASSKHASEQLTSDGFDITLVNDGTLEDLYTKVDEQIA